MRSRIVRPARWAVSLALAALVLSCSDGPVGPSFGIVQSGLKGGIVNVSYADTLRATGGSKTKNWTVMSGILPPGLTLLSNGVLSGTPLSAGTFDATLRVVSAKQKRTRAFTIVIVPALTITTTSLVDGLENAVYADTLDAAGGVGGYAWMVSAGALPAGVTLSAAGVLAGAPTIAGLASVTVQVTSGTQVATKPLSITVVPSLAVSTTTLADGIVGQPYTDTLEAVGTSGPMNWGIQSGAPPAGLTLLSSGILTGTPTTPGNASFTVQVTSGANTATKALGVNIVAALAMTTLTLPNATVGNAYAQTLVATGGTGAFTWSIVAGAPPAGLNLSAAGVLDGIPTTPANTNFTVRVTSGSQQVERAFAVLVSPADAASVEITPPSAPIELGDSLDLTAAAKDAGGVVLPGRPIAWTTLNGAVATVSGTGRVRALTLGSVGIVASATGTGGATVSDTAIMTVTPRPVDSVEVTPNEASLLIGETQQMNTVLRDRFGNVLAGRTVTWSSSDANVAAIDINTGIVVSGAAGTATITALSEGIQGTATVRVSRGLILTAVAGGERHSCGLSEANLVFCWGRNLEGELGDSSTVDRLFPVRVRGTTSFVTLRVGSRHDCALTSNGIAYCWGSNSAGRLGIGTADTIMTYPTQVAGGIVFAQLTAGGTHTCGLTAAGAAYCWGLNLSGQLGDNSINSKSVPTLVAGGFTFAAITAGGNHTCALTAAGAAYCWGLNSFAQVGDSTFGAGTNRIVPTAVKGGHVFVRISAGNSHSCGIADDGITYCWGSNGSVAATAGRLGDGTTVAQRIAPTPVTGGLAFTDVIAGGVHTCARTALGAVYCWGANDTGQLGDGTFTSRTSPVPLFGGFTWDAFGVGNFHGCALRDSGRTFCWGQNSQGAVGDGTVSNRNEPVPVRP